MKDFIQSELQEAHSALQRLLEDQATIAQIEQAGKMIAHALGEGSRVWSAGNGGSMCDAMHFAEELSGRYREDRPGLAAVAFSDPGFLTCAANDFGYEKVFARAVESHCKAGDVLILFSTSGKSPNIIAAATQAKNQQVKVIALTGKSGSSLDSLAEICIVTQGGQYADRVQELHIKVVHILIALTERLLFNKG
ncbi:MAG: SIS domain-containing protein [Fimbriimonadaceae bacterium]|nr:SIS domain-containing protein [Fimbriimonadaceae bacterium]